MGHTSRVELKEWFDEAPPGTSHMIVACDQFSYEDYPIYVPEGEDPKKHRPTGEMVQVHECYRIDLGWAAQSIENVQNWEWEAVEPNPVPLAQIGLAKRGPIEFARPDVCDAEHYDYPGVMCTFPKGHGPIVDEESGHALWEHAAPEKGAWWGHIPVKPAEPENKIPRSVEALDLMRHTIEIEGLGTWHGRYANGQLYFRALDDDRLPGVRPGTRLKILGQGDYEVIDFNRSSWGPAPTLVLQVREIRKIHPDSATAVIQKHLGWSRDWIDRMTIDMVLGLAQFLDGLDTLDVAATAPDEAKTGRLRAFLEGDSRQARLLGDLQQRQSVSHRYRPFLAIREGDRVEVAVDGTDYAGVVKSLTPQEDGTVRVEVGPL